MMPSEMRALLLEQHDSIRSKVDDARSAIHGLMRGESAADRVRGYLAELAEAVGQHNRREDELLSGMIVTVDAWGPARAEIMSEEHDQEHVEIHAALIAASKALGPEDAAEVAELLERLIGRLSREEQAFLAADVLRDDGILIDELTG